MLNALWQKYNSIPRMGRIWIAATTGVVAYFGGEMVDRMYDDYVIREEAERRVKQEVILSASGDKPKRLNPRTPNKTQEQPVNDFGSVTDCMECYT